MTSKVPAYIYKEHTVKKYLNATFPGQPDLVGGNPVHSKKLELDGFQ